MKAKFPQQVETAACIHTQAADVTKESEKIDLGLGQGEIAIVLASYMSIYRTKDGLQYMWLYRKTAEQPITIHNWENGPWSEDPAVLDHFFDIIDALSDVGVYERIRDIYKVYPYPYLLIRNPSLRTYSSHADDQFTARLWFMREKVADKELAELMVKDHA